MDKLNDLRLWEIRGDDYRLFLDFGSGRAFVGAMRKKLKGSFSMDDYRHIEREVREFREAVERDNKPCDEEM